MAIRVNTTLTGLLIHCVAANLALADDQQAWLSAHNALRAKHCVPAMTWSAQVAASAQEWANTCPKLHEQQSVYGENLFTGTAGTYSPQFATTNWYDEIAAYNFSAPGFSKPTGHFTQVVWRNSTKLGCAKALCSGLDYFVCRYSPPGNFAGQFPQNVPASCAEKVPKPPAGFDPGMQRLPDDRSVKQRPGADIFRKMKP